MKKLNKEDKVMLDILNKYLEKNKTEYTKKQWSMWSALIQARTILK